jgi:hypothetical protein
MSKTRRCFIITLPNIIRMIKPRRMRWAEHVEQMGEERKAYRLLARRAEGKRPPERTRCRWVDNTEMDLREIGWGGMDCNDLAQDRDQFRALVSTVLNLRVPQNVG